jgi:transposase
VFEDFVEQQLHHCSPNAVFIMDNASFHHSERIKEMCLEAGVELLYLPPYSLDLNPIEEFFAELKAFIKKQWHEYESSPHREFRAQQCRISVIYHLCIVEGIPSLGQALRSVWFMG